MEKKYKQCWTDMIGIVVNDDEYAMDYNKEDPQFPLIKVIEYGALEKAEKHISELETKNGLYWDRADLAESELSKALDKIEELEKELKECKARLAHRHIIGKAYEISAESINKLAGELDEVKEQLRLLEEKLALY